MLRAVPDDLSDGTHICNQLSYFLARQAVGLYTKTKDDLVVIYNIIEMDGKGYLDREHPMPDWRDEDSQDETM